MKVIILDHYDFWVDISNTPQVFFFSSILKSLQDKYSIFITARSRGEIEALLRMFNMNSKVFGRDYSNSILKTLSIGMRTVQLLYKAPKFDIALSFENPMPILSAKARRKKVILFLDNDIKLITDNSRIQNLETQIKKLSDIVIVPKVSYEVFQKAYKRSKVLTYDGYKEHIYIAEYEPEEDFLAKNGLDEYVVLRPEAMASLYVNGDESLVSKIIKRLEQEEIKVVYLPRDPGDERLVIGYKNVYVPPHPLNGLDLAYHAKVVLTGSGTMAREAAVLGTPAVSFFPSKALLSVDQDLINKGKMVHSRDVNEIATYIKMNWDKEKKGEYQEAKRVKKQVLQLLDDII